MYKYKVFIIEDETRNKIMNELFKLVKEDAIIISDFSDLLE